MLKRYIQVAKLLDDDKGAQFDAVQKIIEAPDFIYQKESCPKFLTDIFVRSSYWLDKELFDETHICTKDSDSLQPEQRLHIQMLDIGSTLISKGFPLEYHQKDYEQKGPHMLSPYVKSFIAQCHKRYAFLSPKKVAEKKRLLKGIQINQHS